MASFFWLVISLFGTLFQFAWRGALLFGAIFLIDEIAPGLVPCVFRETIGYDAVLLALSKCTVSSNLPTSLISIAVLFSIVFLLTYPVRRFSAKLFETLFMCLNILLIGYPLKFIAYLASIDPTFAGKIFDNSYLFGPLSTAMPAIFPHEYKYDSDHLWEVYYRSQTPAHEHELETLLEELEAKHFK